MPRRKTRQKSQLADRETAICLRIREARDLAEVTQEKLAELIGVPRDRLSTYEKCRAPLRFETGLRVCRQLIISEEWLATGATAIIDNAARDQFRLGPKSDLSDLRKLFKRQCYDLQSEPTSLGIPPDTLFSVAYDRYLAKSYAQLAKKHFYFPRIVLRDELCEPQLASRVIRTVFDRCLFLLDHLARKQSVDSWLVQRNFTRAIFGLTHKCYREFIDLGLDIGDFQHFIATIERLERVPEPQPPATLSRQKTTPISRLK